MLDRIISFLKVVVPVIVLVVRLLEEYDRGKSGSCLGQGKPINEGTKKKAIPLPATRDHKVS